MAESPAEMLGSAEVPGPAELHADPVMRLRGLLPSLVPSLRRVAAVIIADPARAATLTITELALAARTSETTVVRLCHELGVRGYRDLRVALAAERGRAQGRAEHHARTVAGSDISRHDRLDHIIATISAADAEAIAETARTVDRAVLATVVDALARARRIDTFGVGASAFVAADLQQKLHRIGLVSFAWSDQHAALTAGALLGPRDVFVAVSHTGVTRDAIETVQLARTTGATTVAITSVPRSPLARLAQHTLVTASREMTFRSGATASRIAALSLVDMLFVAVAQRRYDRTMQALDRTRRAVAVRRTAIEEDP